MKPQYVYEPARYVSRPDDTPSAFDQLADSLGAAVSSLVRALDPTRTASRGPSLGPFAPLGAPTPTATDWAHRETGRRPDHGRHAHVERLGRCEPTCGRDNCHCRCCIGDVDLVVYARLGEVRIVPLRIENRRRRDADITLQLSEFRTRGGGPTPVHGRLLPPTSFTLPGCLEREAVVVISDMDDVNPKTEFPQGKDRSRSTKADLVAEAHEVGITQPEDRTKAELFEQLEERDSTESPRPVPVPDVDECHVAIADLLIEGCDARPIRIAVALLPRDCGAFEVHCDCWCC